MVAQTCLVDGSAVSCSAARSAAVDQHENHNLGPDLDLLDQSAVPSSQTADNLG